MAATLYPSAPVLATPESVTLPKQSEASSVSESFRGIRSYKSCRQMTEVRQLHCQSIKNGLSHESVSLRNLVTACTEMGLSESLGYACKAVEVFMEDRGTANVTFEWNSLIRGYSHAGLGEEALFLYLKLISKGAIPDHFTFPFLLSACSKIAAFRMGVQVHGLVNKMSLFEDLFIQNSLIHFYFECGEVADGQKVFDKMHDKNVVSWTSLICGYGRNDLPMKAVSVFFKMVEAGIEPSAVTMVGAISACAKVRDLDLAKKVCAYVGELGLKENIVLVNAIVDMYMKCGAIDEATQLFDECVDKNLVLYNTILSNFVRHGLARRALDTLNEMLQNGPQPDNITLLSAISASAQLDDLLLGMRCHGYVLRYGLEGSDSICNAVIDMYTKCGKQDVARRVFDHMSNKTVVSWNSLIAGYVRNGDLQSAWDMFNEMPEIDLVSWNTIIGALVQESLFEEAIELFRVMQSNGIKADRVTMVSVASACGYLGALNLAKWAYAYIDRNEIQCDMLLSTALIDMFARCGDSQNAMLVFNKMKERDVTAWTAVIGAMAIAGNGKQAIELFNDMLRQDVKPDPVVFVRLLAACSHCGLVEEGQYFFSSMREIYGISPQIVHYGCMVDLLGRAGLIEQGLSLIKTMPMEPNDVVWGALLAACRTHKNVEIAAYAAERMRQSAHERTGVSVLLSNIYACARKWSDVAALRIDLKDKGVHKVPGSSSIEINGVIYEFTSGHESQPNMACIAPMLHEMNCRFRYNGYTADLTNVLLDVDELEKEYLLSRHSEKLALAFGLINTSKENEIRIVKNLRMCSDCHTFTKLASKIYAREIVVRDNNRFHFFQQGLCSCGDYW